MWKRPGHPMLTLHDFPFSVSQHLGKLGQILKPHAKAWLAGFCKLHLTPGFVGFICYGKAEVH